MRLGGGMYAAAGASASSSCDQLSSPATVNGTECILAGTLNAIREGSASSALVDPGDAGVSLPKPELVFVSKNACSVRCWGTNVNTIVALPGRLRTSFWPLRTRL